MICESMLSDEHFNKMKELRMSIIKNDKSNMTLLLNNLSKDEVVRIINCYPRNNQNHLTLLNLSLGYDTSHDRKYTKFLLENGANPNLEFKKTYDEILDNKRFFKETMTAIMFESRIGNEKNVELLIKYGADIYKKDKNGKNSIDHAIEGQNVEVIRTLKKEKRRDCSRITKIFYNISNLNNDCIQNIVSFCF